MYNSSTTNSYSASNSEAFASTLLNQDTYYIGIGNSLSSGDDSKAGTYFDNQHQNALVYDNLIAGLKVNTYDISLSIERVVWTTGTIYNQYSAYDQTTCHVTVESTSMYNTYKCLSNNYGAASTTAPSITTSLPFTTADGYVWIYMFSVPVVTYNKFKTQKTAPYLANTARIDASIPSTTSSIEITDPGKGYVNTVYGALSATDIRVSNNITYKMPASASNINNAYIGYVMRITNSNSPAFGLYRTIVGYVGSTRIATLDTAFTLSPIANDTFAVSAKISIVGSGSKSENGIAIAVIANTSISSVEILSRGKLLRSAVASLTTGIAPQRPAAFKCSISPPKGHGGDPTRELTSKGVTIYSSINFNTIGLPEANDYRTISLIKNPTFTEVGISVASGYPTKFSAGEEFLQYRTSGSIGNTSYNGTVLTGTGTTFLKSLSVGSYVIMAAGSNRFITKISSITSDTVAVGSTSYSGTFAGQSSIAAITGRGKILNVAPKLLCDQVTARVSVGENIYGVVSRSSDAILSITLNGRAITEFSSFIQLSSYTGSITGIFAIDEAVQNSNNIGIAAPVAYVHSAAVNKLYLTKQFQNLSVSTLLGSVSGSTMVPTTKYPGDLNIDSGNILYVNNTLPITKAANKATEVRFVFQF